MPPVVAAAVVYGAAAYAGYISIGAAIYAVAMSAVDCVLGARR